ncbi:M10 family metallopeptidase C-terminal domain-containing protein [Rhodopseudomonas sp. HC1]|uniref:M10 family metallopeptidase C-terminal domain-containing protein n=1 Tax=Rhodopseudomonas infernalis TaxID=2897386 RepID=UPI001EE8B74D|nr:M10 family metallopeptidase C-terminal domain-containing protein [Rhodopseudomonas infernalis]MCG6206407.1 M10 family metallopeptidase C-terminal domain-containing protein [Rhodopseudomonas infernalis]
MPILPSVIETTDAAASTSTSYNLSIGQTAQGTIASSGDHDWYRVNLVAGQTYTFAMVGTGIGGVPDSYLRILNAAGTLVAQNDDGLPNNNSVLTYTATTSGSYYIDAAAFGNSGTGRYGISIAAGSRAIVDIPMGAGIIDAYDSSSNYEYSWSATPGTGATVTVGFRLTNDNLEPNFSQFSSEQIAAVHSILAYYSDVCGLTFNVASSYTDNATILLSNYNNSDGSGGYGAYPGSTDPGSQAGNIHINLAGGSSTTSVPVGSYSFYTLMHELGHTVGLTHPGLYNAGPGVSPTYANSAQFTEDTVQYSVMSYFDEANTGANLGGYPDTLMLYDIYALQQIYGANTSTRSGNSIYGFHSNVGGIYDFSVNTSAALCIWDGGGIDTLDCSGYGASEFISLISGSFSNIGGLTSNVSIAVGAVIENAIGGGGNDTIQLSSDNVNNVVDGGGGSDTVYLSYSYGYGYTLSGSASNFVINGSAGVDTLRNFEYVHFSNGVTVATTTLFDSSTATVRNDFNGDGRSDLLLQNGQVLAEWLISGTSVLAGSGGLASALGSGWSVAGTGDFNGDGHADILLRNGTQLAEWQMNGTTVQSGSNTISSALGAGWNVVGTGDFNGDGRDDILLQNGGQLAEWLMNGTTLQPGSSSLNSSLGTGWSVVGTGDFNNDGNDDILLQNGTQLAEWLMNGTTILPGSGTISSLGSGWSVAGIGDFNGDGSSDILLRNGQVLAEWLMNGTSVLGGSGNVSSTLGSGWSVAGTGDFDGDRHADILLQNGAQLAQWRMNGTALQSGSGGIGALGSGWHVA